MANHYGIYIGNNIELSREIKDRMGNHSILCFQNTTECIENFWKKKKEKIDFIVLESNAKDVTLDAFLKMLHSVIDFSSGSLILIKDQTDQSEKQMYLTKGIDDIYTAPVNAEKMIKRINFLIQIKNSLGSAKKEPYSFKYQIPLSKRIFDIVMAGSALLILSPLLILTMIAIRLESKGKVFYASRRVGTGYRIFDFYKFRSMYSNADKRLKDLKNLNQYLTDTGSAKEESDSGDTKRDPEGTVLYDDQGAVEEKSYLNKKQKETDTAFVKIKNDPRITKVGRIIRNTSIDELPQLINVLKGDMSIVGNRPLPVYEAEMLTTDEWIARFMAPAGLTGLWQVEKRAKSSEMSPTERKMLDVEYARSYTFWKDIRIIIRTVRALFQSENV